VVVVVVRVVAGDDVDGIPLPIVANSVVH